MSISLLNHHISVIELILIFLVSLSVRSALFHFFLKNEQRFCQSDSLDYHMSAVCMQHGNGMTRLDNQKPIFWRTPGYPAFLCILYNQVGKLPSMAFSDYEEQHKLALWAQIFFSAFMPLLVALLALLITSFSAVARIAAYYTIFHVGFVLSSGYLLTDALAAVFFVIFLIFLFKALFPDSTVLFISETPAAITAAVSLAVYTWMRPMGQFVGIIAAMLLLFRTCQTLNMRLIKTGLFLGLFFLLLSPWFWRNYQLTGLFFFCPLFGLYFNVFNAPRIIAFLSGIPLEVMHKQFTLAGGYAHAYEIMKHAGNSVQLCPEYICLSTSLPVLLSHPIFFIVDWLRELCKTTFDLFSYQLVAFHQECFKWDPLVEFLYNKLAACLWGSSLPLTWRLIAWSELCVYIILWSGIISGLYTYVFKPWWKNEKFSDKNFVWLFSAILVCSVVGQTGGFGYARLRLPIEPLLIIGGIWFWWEYFSRVVHSK